VRGLSTSSRDLTHSGQHDWCWDGSGYCWSRKKCRPQIRTRSLFVVVLDRLNADEVMDLLAYLLAEGDERNPVSRQLRDEAWARARMILRPRCLFVVRSKRAGIPSRGE
jgi:hypothetical protein